MKDILIVNSPFLEAGYPSIQLGVLHSYLLEKGFSVDTRHLHLTIVPYLGYPVNKHLSYISTTTGLLFTKVLFPIHWKKNFLKIYRAIGKSYHLTSGNRFFNIWKITKNINLYINNLLAEIPWSDYRYIGFSTSKGQLIPNLAIAKMVKLHYPNVKTIIGGAEVYGDIGLSILKSFDFVDFVVNGEGEIPLSELLSGTNHSEIPGLVYRNNNDISFNPSIPYPNLDDLPAPNYDSYFEELHGISDTNLKSQIQSNLLLSLEGSRGCWWNKCSFCSLNLQFNKYRQKSPNKIVHELTYLSDKYKSLFLCFCDNIMIRKNYAELFKKMIDADRNWSVFYELRAKHLKKSDYELMSKAGIERVQIGVETLSKNMMKKINKGVRVIDNLQSIKHCIENDINVSYNLLAEYPNEEPIDLKETFNLLEETGYFFHPPDKGATSFMLQYQSPIFKHYKKYNIASYEPAILLHQYAFPKEISRQIIPYFYRFKRNKKLLNTKKDWDYLISHWTNIYEQYLVKKALTYRLSKNFLTIVDLRKNKFTQILISIKDEMELFLFCDIVRTFKEIKENFNQLDNDTIKSILHRFIKLRIMYEEDGHFLSLPVLHKP